LSLPQQLLLRDLLKRRVRCSQGLDRGAGVAAWMHPPVHRVLGWVTRPSTFGERRLVWRLDQLRDLGELEVLVKGEPADTDADTVLRLPTLFDAVLLDRHRQPIGSLVDAVLEPRTGRIVDYLVSRSDPRLPGSSRWRLSPDRIIDQQPGRVFTALEGLDDLPLARASVRQELLRRSRRWRDQVQQVGDRLEQRVEGWLEEPFDDGPRQGRWSNDRMEPEPAQPGPDASGAEPWDEGWDDDDDGAAAAPPPRRQSRRPPAADRDDPWI
jgi:hypothetical protein